MRAPAVAERFRASASGAASLPESSPVDRVVRRRCSRVLATLVAAFALASPAAGAQQSTATEDIGGLWVDHRDGAKRKVAVWIEECDGLLCGRIYWLRKPLSAGGQPKRDRHNPDPALRERPLCGLRILIGFRLVKETSWSAGHVYNPNDGRTFSSTIDLEHDGSLRIRGYVGLSLFGETMEWVRPQEPLERCGLHGANPG
jgi:uncharacterized protein (DUF2147 family)